MLPDLVRVTVIIDREGLDDQRLFDLGVAGRRALEQMLTAQGQDSSLTRAVVAENGDVTAWMPYGSIHPVLQQVTDQVGVRMRAQVWEPDNPQAALLRRFEDQFRAQGHSEEDIRRWVYGEAHPV